MLAQQSEIVILAVDDEPLNLDILLEYFEDDGYKIITANDGVEAWNILQNTTVDVIVLDRMMPNMDGITLLKTIKKTEKLKNTPVIMQTAASSVNEVREGVEAGAFYYLSKPYKKELLLSIVKAAIADSKKYKIFLDEKLASDYALQLITHAHFQFRTLEDINPISLFISQACHVNRDKHMSWGLTELMINAVEHGNLGIRYDEKKKLLIEGRWLEEIQFRLTQEAYKDKWCQLELIKTPTEATITITDQGLGFAYEQYLEIDLTRVMDPNGRGIAISKQNSFDDVQYLGNGNVVRCKISLE